MREEYVYGIIRKMEEIYEVKKSKAYQINWVIGHLPTRNTFISLTAPVFEHNFEVIFFPEEEGKFEDNTSLINLVRGMVNG